jgi:hypothetical protein
MPANNPGNSSYKKFDEHKIEKLAIEDGNGNKAKLSRTKDNGIKIEYSSTVLM